MRKTLSLLVLTFIALWAMAANAPVVQAATPLPPSAWYAVVWNRSDDTLHWVNNATELASTPRPKLPGEAAAGLPGLDTRVHISPNGRYLMHPHGPQPVQPEQRTGGYWSGQRRKLARPRL